MSNSTEMHQTGKQWMNKRMDEWINEQMGAGRGGGRGDVSCSRPSADDKRSSLQLSQVDSHFRTVARLPHPDLENKDRQIRQHSHLEIMHSKA